MEWIEPVMKEDANAKKDVESGITLIFYVQHY